MIFFIEVEDRIAIGFQYVEKIQKKIMEMVIIIIFQKHVQFHVKNDQWVKKKKEYKNSKFHYYFSTIL